MKTILDKFKSYKTNMNVRKTARQIIELIYLGDTILDKI